MKFKQTLIHRIILLLLLIIVWDGFCYAQNDSIKVRRGKRIDPLPIVSDPLSEDTFYSYEEETEDIIPVEPATATGANDEYLEQPVKAHDFDERSWSEAVEGLDYSKDTPEEKVTRQDHDPALPPPNTSLALGPIGQVLLIGLVALLLGWILFLIVGGKYRKNSKIKNEKEFTIEDIEERMHESDLDRFLREALAKGDFRLAVRIYYLAIIKELSTKELIRWKKDKTNREYLNEVVARKPEIYKDFRDTTLAFEKVWYGDIKITEGDYMSISPRFKRFIEGLGRLS